MQQIKWKKPTSNDQTYTEEFNFSLTHESKQTNKKMVN